MAQLPEDWLMEIETLQAVYMDQLKQKEAPNILEIILWPNPDAKDDSENQVGLSLEVTLRKDYPNEIPDLMVRPLKGVTSKQSKELLEKLVEQAKELVGMQMVFPLAQYLKDWLDEQNKDNLAKQKDAAKAKEELEIEKEKEEYARRYKDGTPVTLENFKAWWPAFLSAHPEKPQWNADVVVTTKLTGKQLFERGALANVDLEGLTASAERTDTSSPAPVSSVASSSGANAAPSGANVDWDLFVDEGDLPDDEE